MARRVTADCVCVYKIKLYSNKTNKKQSLVTISHNRWQEMALSPRPWLVTVDASPPLPFTEPDYRAVYLLQSTLHIQQQQQQQYGLISWMVEASHACQLVRATCGKIYTVTKPVQRNVLPFRYGNTTLFYVSSYLVSTCAQLEIKIIQHIKKIIRDLQSNFMVRNILKLHWKHLHFSVTAHSFKLLNGRLF